MSETNSPEAVAVELMKLVMAADPNYACSGTHDETKAMIFALYQECLAVVKG